MKFSILALASMVGVASAFCPPSQVGRSGVSSTAIYSTGPLHKAGAAFIAASTILSNVIVPPDAFAAESFFANQPTTELIAARSGGRAGGRSSAPRRSAPAPSRPTRVIERQTTIIQQPSSPMYAAPPMGYAAPPMGYASPAPSGLGLAIGLNAVSGIASGMREARQESEIRSTRDQLTETRIKEAEMEARLKGLEQQQMIQQMQK